MSSPQRWLFVLVAFVLLVAACGSDDDSESTETGASGDASAVGSGEGGDNPADAGANPYAGYESEIYGDADLWHCRPDRDDDVCDVDLTTTDLGADGSLTEVPFTPVSSAPIDCFYVYPTVDYAAEPGNHSFDDDNPLEPVTVQTQAARFGEVCNLYAPRYRQATIGSYDAARGEDDLFDYEAFATAYGDVLDAFSHYMGNDNGDRPIVLIGHSQGSHHLLKLLQDEFDAVPAMRDRLVSALLIGPTGRLSVPDGEVVGGSLQNLPLCTAADETGCVIAFDSYAADAPPATLFAPEGQEPACVSPSELVDGDDRLQRGVFGRTQPDVATATEAVGDYYTGSCVADDAGLAYFEVAEEPGPGDERDLAHIESQLERGESLHVLDINFTIGDLLEIVDRQASTVG